MLQRYITEKFVRSRFLMRSENGLDLDSLRFVLMEIRVLGCKLAFLDEAPRASLKSDDLSKAIL